MSMSKILVIDDEALAREAISRLLRHEGFEVTTARNGKEAWASLYHEVPDLILLDLMMPEWDGVTFLTMLRRSSVWGDVPVVVLTGADDRDRLISRAWELGVSDLIPKASFGFDELVGRVRQHAQAGNRPAAPTARTAPARDVARRPSAWRPSTPGVGARA